MHASTSSLPTRTLRTNSLHVALSPSRCPRMGSLLEHEEPSALFSVLASDGRMAATEVLRLAGVKVRGLSARKRVHVVEGMRAPLLSHCGGTASSRFHPEPLVALLTQALGHRLKILTALESALDGGTVAASNNGVQGGARDETVVAASDADGPLSVDDIHNQEAIPASKANERCDEDDRREHDGSERPLSALAKEPSRGKEPLGRKLSSRLKASAATPSPAKLDAHSNPARHGMHH
eukprot:4390999-Prymnesium_polylepis.1